MANIYVHPGEDVGLEASGVLTQTLFGANCDLIVTRTGSMVSHVAGSKGL